MPPGREGYQEEEQLDPQTKLGEAEKKLLAAIFGKTARGFVFKSDEGGPWEESLDPVALATLLTTEGYPLPAAWAIAFLRWLQDEALTTNSQEISDKLGLFEKSAAPGVLATLLTSARHASRNRATAELVQRWMQNHAPTTQIEEISILASAVIGDRDKATKWLSESNPAMDNRPPIDLIGEKDGYDRVKNLLLRIEYGALA